MAVVTRKRHVITISSSDHADSDDDNHSRLSSSEDDYQLIDDDDDDDSDDDYVVDDSYEEDKENKCNNVVVVDDDDGDKFEGDDENAFYNRVIHYLQENEELRKLNLNVCKAYLRRHKLRVSGTKDECVKRIHEHWRIKDGEAESLYPRSSFVINCTGDVCKRDVVLFTQKVYDSFDKKTRNGSVLGKRVVAGQVVKESYGAAKQQHTFTVEVLWSKGIKKLPPLFPLLIKGRNLYRLKTYRQPWKNEAERKEVLDEKHRRGALARSKRDKKRGTQPSDNGRKSQKVSNSTKPSHTSYSQKDKFVDRDRRASSPKHSSTGFNHQPAVLMKEQAAAHATKPNSQPFPKHFQGHQVSSIRSHADGHQKVPNSTKPSLTSYSRKDKLIRDRRASSTRHSSTGFNHNQPAVLMKEQVGAHATKPNSQPFPKHFPGHQVSSFRSHANSHQNYSEQRMPLNSISVEHQRVFPHQDYHFRPVSQRVFPHQDYHIQPLAQRVFPHQDY